MCVGEEFKGRKYVSMLRNEENHPFKEDMISFGRWVFEKRTEMGMTLDELAEKTGICKFYLARLEKGECSNPRYVE